MTENEEMTDCYTLLAANYSWLLQEGVRDLLSTTLNERERDIIGLYYGLDEESRSWEDISRRYDQRAPLWFNASRLMPFVIAELGCRGRE